METEYGECLKAATSNVMEEPHSNDKLRAKRTKISLLTPLIQCVRELNAKQKEIAELETLLKGECAIQLPHKEFYLTVFISMWHDYPSSKIVK